jgi:hypothetical protein
MFKEYDVVALKRDVTRMTLPKSTEGVVLHVHDTTPPGAYVVEFFDGHDNSVGVYDVYGDELELKNL